MQLKRRILETGQEVLIVYRKDLGFIQDKAFFKEYRSVSVGAVQHQTPFFICGKEELSGLDCFWLLPQDIQSSDEIPRIQQELIEVQIAAIEIGLEANYHIPRKIVDTEIEKMATENHERSLHIINKLGFDPRDESWIETELSENDLDRKWFAFERQNGSVFYDPETKVQTFNKETGNNISVDQAKALAKKRMRYLMGAFHTRSGGNANVADWRSAARSFEKKHREREDRMLKWSQDHKDRFPLARVTKPVTFWYGPFYNQCVERIPQVFADTGCQKIKEGVILRVVSYDPLDKFIRLDFTTDVRALLKPDSTEEPWRKEGADYEIWVTPQEVETHLEFLSPVT